MCTQYGSPWSCDPPLLPFGPVEAGDGGEQCMSRYGGFAVGCHSNALIGWWWMITARVKAAVLGEEGSWWSQTVVGLEEETDASKSPLGEGLRWVMPLGNGAAVEVLDCPAAGGTAGCCAGV